jgi:hypothetical protein
VALIAFLVHRVDWAEAGEVFGGVSVLRVGGGLFLFVVAQFLCAVRLWYLLGAESAPVPLAEAIRLTAVGLFANNFLPGTIGGDGVKIYDLIRSGHARGTSVAAIATDRVLNLAALAAGLMLLAFAPGLLPGRLGIWVALIAPVILLLAYLLIRRTAVWSDAHPQPEQDDAGLPLRVRAFRCVRRLLRSGLVYFRRPGVLAIGFGFSLLSAGTMLAACWAAAAALFGEAGFIDVAAAYVMVYFVSLAPVSLNGWGLQEAGIVFFLARAGLPEPAGAGAAILIRLYQLAASLPGGFLVLRDRALVPPRGENDHA